LTRDGLCRNDVGFGNEGGNKMERKVKGMKSTDVPNGFVVGAYGGKNMLIDFDDTGKVVENASEIGSVGWPEEVMVNGVVREDLMVLIHSVKGEDSILIKRLAVNQFMLGGKISTGREVAKCGALYRLAEDAWKGYMEELIHNLELANQIQESKVEVGVS
jgi:hypothetical protein